MPYALAPKLLETHLTATISVAAAQTGIFAILVNKICKIMKTFEQLNHLRSRWVLNWAALESPKYLKK